jgi:hypothetical protein
MRGQAPSLGSFTEAARNRMSRSRDCLFLPTAGTPCAFAKPGGYVASANLAARVAGNGGRVGFAPLGVKLATWPMT